VTKRFESPLAEQTSYFVCYGLRDFQHDKIFILDDPHRKVLKTKIVAALFETDPAVFGARALSARPRGAYRGPSEFRMTAEKTSKDKQRQQ
jgi:hypothetical protein